MDEADFTDTMKRSDGARKAFTFIENESKGVAAGSAEKNGYQSARVVFTDYGNVGKDAVRSQGEGWRFIRLVHYAITNSLCEWNRIEKRLVATAHEQYKIERAHHWSGWVKHRCFLRHREVRWGLGEKRAVTTSAEV